MIPLYVALRSCQSYKNRMYLQVYCDYFSEHEALQFELRYSHKEYRQTQVQCENAEDAGGNTLAMKCSKNSDSDGTHISGGLCKSCDDDYAVLCFLLMCSVLHVRH